MSFQGHSQGLTPEQILPPATYMALKKSDRGGSHCGNAHKGTGHTHKPPDGKLPNLSTELMAAKGPSLQDCGSGQ